MPRPAQSLFGLLLISAALLASPTSAQASFTVNFDYEFSNSGSGHLDAGKLVFTQSGNDVLATFTGGPGLGSGGFISELYFNLKNIASITASSFTAIYTANFSGVSEFNYGSNAFKADGDGFFDVKVSFEKNNQQGPPPRFKDSSILQFKILNTTLDDVQDISVNGPEGKNGFFGAVHAQGLGANGKDSGWYTDSDQFDPILNPVPAPAGLLLVATAIPFLLLRRVFSRPVAV